MSSTLAINALLASVVAEKNGPPGLVFGAVDRYGNVLARCSAGLRSLNDPSSTMTCDSVFPIFSCTKMIAGIAVMKLVEEGKLDLDEPVDKLLPEVAAATIMHPDGTETAPKTKITMRMLLTHTAGYSYTFFSETIKAWAEKKSTNEFLGARAGIEQPLIREPNTEFNYGVNIDWAGIAVERVTKMTLGAYCQEILFGPLGLKDTSFAAPSGDRLARLVSLHQRAEDDTLTVVDHFAFATGGAGGFHSGGGGLISTADDYLKCLTVLINEGVGAGGVRILKAETVKEMFRDQIGHLTPEKGLNKVIDVSIPHLGGKSAIPFEPFPGKGWGLTFLLIKDEFPTGRTPGSATWAGLANLYWTADPVKGVANFILSQSLPYGCGRVINAWLGSEGIVYANLAAQKKAELAFDVAALAL